MKITGRLLAVSAALLPRTAQVWGQVTDAGSFNSLLENNDHTLVAFIHPTSETTPTLLHEWSLLPSHPTIHPHPLDCSLHAPLCASLSITSFPTIRLYHSSPTTFTRYRGPRFAAPIAAFLRRMLRPAITPVTAANMTSLFASDDVVFVAHGLKTLGSGGEEAGFEAVVGRYKDRYTFAVALDGVVEGEGARVECYNVPDRMQHTLSLAARGMGAMEAFIEQCATPLVPELTRRNELVYYSGNKPLVHYLHHTPSQRPGFVDAVRPLARRYTGQIQFLTTSIAEYGGAEAVAGIFGLEPERVGGGRTAVVVQDLRTGGVVVYEGEVEAGGVEGWLVGVLGGDGGAGRGGREEL
ncbi:hypothetical protein QBC39DRAFT_399775 [Podospora conica]|nr:hypothetical protein QBC39DRAFT_399775 [Schizothecium conicum]